MHNMEDNGSTISETQHLNGCNIPPDSGPPLVLKVMTSNKDGVFMSELKYYCMGQTLTNLEC